MALAALLFDLGDCVMREETEQKVDGVTQRAELVPGMADLLHDLKRQGHRLALVADTRVGTYRNVLHQHGLVELFDAFAISDEVGVQKPDRRMFLHALEALAIPRDDWGRVVMVGNNLARDVRGANALGLITVWMVWNPDYPTQPSGPEEVPAYQVATADELGRLLDALDGDQDAAAFSHPQPFPWLQHQALEGAGLAESQSPLSELIAERRDGQPLIGAHRGGAAYAPENTLAAFAEGIRRGAHMLELDIHLSRDGEVIVIHDHAVDRTTSGQGAVHDLTLAELKELDAGSWFDPRFAGERIPTLAEAIEFVDRRLPLTIEVKGLPRTGEALCDALVSLLEARGATDNVLVIAFDHWNVRQIKERNQRIKAAINYSGRLVDPIHAGRSARADVLNQSWLYCDADFCRQAHAEGFAVQCFAPSAAQAWDLAQNGVDIMDTDEPDVIVAATRRGTERPDGRESAFG